MMTTDRRTQADQKTTIERLLGDEQVLVHINPSQPGVVIPPYLMDNRTVTLRLSRFFKGKLSTTEDAIAAELLFGPEYFVCTIPWNSIWGASSVRGEEFVWTEVTPPEILHLVLAQEEQALSAERTGGRPRVRTARAAGGASHLRRVK
jgi:hypothetical protein